ncbi:hypothetical protein P378_10710 [Desulforamulus profundi]|uniref:Uncharacterized protein n=1 Tax=Desulforamulus profundi TaxID=1383067 RepID=A0A2C6MF61_9FIRM|nr:hypothetical protein [Desulforamulus profundi]PHJ38295.1 hypothetical protein P378_10710 [Desulforamulus profundi]
MNQKEFKQYIKTMVNSMLEKIPSYSEEELAEYFSEGFSDDYSEDFPEDFDQDIPDDMIEELANDLARWKKPLVLVRTGGIPLIGET